MIAIKKRVLRVGALKHAVVLVLTSVALYPISLYGESIKWEMSIHSNASFFESNEKIDSNRSIHLNNHRSIHCFWPTSSSNDRHHHITSTVYGHSPFQIKRERFTTVMLPSIWSVWIKSTPTTAPAFQQTQPVLTAKAVLHGLSQMFPDKSTGQRADQSYTCKPH